MTSPRLSVSLVVFRPDLDVLASTLRSLRDALALAERGQGLAGHLYVVDNSCEPAWASQVEEVLGLAFDAAGMQRAELIVSPRNGGYGFANNLAIARAHSDFHLVLNPDVQLMPDALQQAVDCMQSDARLGLLVPAVQGEDGERHYLCKRNPTLLIMLLRAFGPAWARRAFAQSLDKFEMRDRDYDQEIDGVDFPTGSFMFFRTSTLKQIGAFDTRFFMYYEDADIGRRMGKIASVRYVPKVRIVHRWARGTHHSWKLRWITIKSGLYYLWKWNAPRWVTH